MGNNPPMISQERDLEISNEHFTRDGGSAPRLMHISYRETSPLKQIQQVRINKKGSERLVWVRVGWKDPIWLISYFLGDDVPGVRDVFVNAKTGELLELLAI